MAKLLAALNLPQVGEIKLLDTGHSDDVDSSGALFSIALNDREYMLKAAKREDAEVWVTKLNLLKQNPQLPASAGSSVTVQPDAQAGLDDDLPKPSNGAAESRVPPATGHVTMSSSSAKWEKSSGFGSCCPKPNEIA
eukprot:CAMPEP_0118967544 /NCGR_PEP_ID=MMETSP1173-20130426/4918_1 /TAXON_ID=1034831 /ORGANISM="Rhizochromulina marina cf, Strain CCMP1243" /LENGTH=136 /DNA_ID=CAMNT_0006916529 /DNA_START=431 /DNA_END=841 /DNA_ORIENTATION=+